MLKITDYDESTMMIRNPIRRLPNSDVILRSLLLTLSARTNNNSFIAQAFCYHRCCCSWSLNFALIFSRVFRALDKETMAMLAKELKSVLYCTCRDPRARCCQPLHQTHTGTDQTPPCCDRTAAEGALGIHVINGLTVYGSIYDREIIGTQCVHEIESMKSDVCFIQHTGKELIGPALQHDTTC